jgi:hypothetical protein
MRRAGGSRPLLEAARPLNRTAIVLIVVGLIARMDDPQTATAQVHGPEGRQAYDRHRPGRLDDSLTTRHGREHSGAGFICPWNQTEGLAFAKVTGTGGVAICQTSIDIGPSSGAIAESW